MDSARCSPYGEIWQRLGGCSPLAAVHPSPSLTAGSNSGAAGVALQRWRVHLPHWRRDPAAGSGSDVSVSLTGGGIQLLDLAAACPSPSLAARSRGAALRRGDPAGSKCGGTWRRLFGSLVWQSGALSTWSCNIGGRLHDEEGGGGGTSWWLASSTWAPGRAQRAFAFLFS